MLPKITQTGTVNRRERKIPMPASITFTFNDRQELETQIKAFLGFSSPAANQEAPVADEPETTLEKPRRGRPAKAEPTKAEPEKTKTAALVDIVGAIRAFVIADKINNMKRLIPLMPAGKKSLDALDIQEAQRIALQLGLEVD